MELWKRKCESGEGGVRPEELEDMKRKFKAWAINVMLSLKKPSFCTGTRCCCSGKEYRIVACGDDVKWGRDYATDGTTTT